MPGFTIIPQLDSLKINNALITDLGDGDVITITFPNETSSTKNTYGSGAIITPNVQGGIAEVILRVPQGADRSETYMQSLLSLTVGGGNPIATGLLFATFTKVLSDGVRQYKYIYELNGGSFFKYIDIKSNGEGDTDQGISVYSMRFSEGKRIRRKG